MAPAPTGSREGSMPRALPSPSNARLLDLSSFILCIFLVVSVPSPELGLGRGQKLDRGSVHSSEGETAAGHCRVEQRPVSPQPGRACCARQLRWATALSASPCCGQDRRGPLPLSRPLPHTLFYFNFREKWSLSTHAILTTSFFS